MSVHPGSVVRGHRPAEEEPLAPVAAKCEQAGGLSLELEPIEDQKNETRVSFCVANPPQQGFLAQMMEIFNRIDLGITGASVLQVSTGVQHYAVNTFYVRPRKGGRLEHGNALDTQLRRELFNTQILDATSPEYRASVLGAHALARVVVGGGLADQVLHVVEQLARVVADRGDDERRALGLVRAGPRHRGAASQHQRERDQQTQRGLRAIRDAAVTRAGGLREGLSRVRAAACR